MKRISCLSIPGSKPVNRFKPKHPAWVGSELADRIFHPCHPGNPRFKLSLFSRGIVALDVSAPMKAGSELALHHPGRIVHSCTFTDP